MEITVDMISYCVGLGLTFCKITKYPQYSKEIEKRKYPDYQMASLKSGGYTFTKPNLKPKCTAMIHKYPRELYLKSRELACCKILWIVE